VFTLRMDGEVLTDAQWAKTEPDCLGKLSDPGGVAEDHKPSSIALRSTVRSPHNTHPKTKPALR